MKLINFIILLATFSILFNTINSISKKTNNLFSRKSSSSNMLLRNQFKISLSNKMLQNVFDKIKLNLKFMESLENDANNSFVKKTIKKISKNFAKKITKKKNIRKLINNPNNPIKKISKIQKEFTNVMIEVLNNSNNSEFYLDDGEPSKRKVIKEIIKSFEKLYIQQSSPIMNDVKNILRDLYSNN